MSRDLTMAHLNLFAVLQNLEDLVRLDPEMAALAKSWRIRIQFLVRGGPVTYVDFSGGTCRVGPEKRGRPDVILFFTSPAHLNKMFEGSGNPIPLRGFTRLGFLTKEFPRLTDRMEYYLKPTDTLLQDPAYLEINTRMTMNTAAFAIRELVAFDPIGRLAGAHICDGAVNMKVLPDGPAVCIDFQGGKITVSKKESDRPMACLFMKNLQVANDFLNGKLDTFTAAASGDVLIKGQTPMLDSMSLILDRIPMYLS
jgi:hypothetical protein